MSNDDDISPEVRAFLADLSKDDIHTLRAGMPLIRAAIGFGKTTKWLVITLGGVFLGGVMLWDGVLKMLSWMRGN